MSDSEDSTVTYTEVSSPFKDLSDIGSPGVDGLPMMPEDPYAYVVATFQASPSPDYVPGPEEPEQAPPSPEFVPEPVYPEFMPPEDEVFPAEEQPLLAAVSPTTDSPRYIADSDLKEDEEDPEEDPTNYPIDRGDDDDDDDESSDDDEDDDESSDDDEDEDDDTPISLPLDTEVARFLAIPNLPPSPLSPLSSPLPQLLSPLPHILSPPLPILASRSKAPPSGTPPLLPIPLPTPSPPLLLPSTDCRAGVSEVTLPPRKRLCIALGPRYEVGESSSAPTARPTGGFRADYGFVGTLDDEIRRDPERYVGLSQRMTDFVTTVRQDIDEIYVRLDDAHDDRPLMSGRRNMLHRDRRAHARTARLMETEAILSREAWVQSMDASDIARSEVRALRTTVLVQQAEIGALRETNHTRQAQPTKALALMRTLQTQAMIDQGVSDALATRDADINMNGDDSHNLEAGVRWTERVARECTYTDFMKFQPLNFKGTKSSC
ncbi:hypothetical protein Tco_0823557 [Tanacetum coccineum]|uniref:Uncharacterized protein n=1 Tax=Tanacetum coccineum TaxID=301880 RepID=A0ABQ5AMM8_9ASTR